MKITVKKIFTFCSIICISALFISCETMSIITKGTARVLNVAGVLSDSSVEALDRSVDKIETAQTSFTLEEEYYIGRGVASSVLSYYKLYDNSIATKYVNNIAQVMIINSNANEMYNGYHVAILDTDEINAFATSGGHILVTRGLLKITSNEDQLAAVLAHELAHIQKNHSIRSISEDRKNEAWKALGTAAMLTTVDAVESGQKRSNKDDSKKMSDNLAKLSDNFSSLVGESIDTLINNGYSQKFEFEADALALQIMYDSGYNVYAMRDMLDSLEKNTDKASSGFGKTHPSPKDRKKKLKNHYGIYDTEIDMSVRQERFDSVQRNF